MEALLGIPVVPISAAKNEGIEELISHAVHVAKYQERPGRVDFATVRKTAVPCIGVCMRSCILLKIMQKKRKIPVRFAASKLAEGDVLILDSLKLDENEKETLELSSARWKQNGGWTVPLRLRTCGLILSKRCATKR